MSIEIIKYNIERLLKKRKLKISDIENKIGKKRHVTSILSGSSKNPTIGSLQSIATVLEVSIQEIITEAKNEFADNQLFIDVCKVLARELERKSNTLNLPIFSFLDIIKDLYQHSIKLKLNRADGDYCKSLLENKPTNNS